ncbi:hypothetical protein V12B01_13055 [Vibrio splendidus 12B01]|nr:hypothetical protein V12B01_13055 [Vibrio splendidus 12B01]
MCAHRVDEFIKHNYKGDVCVVHIY